MQMIFVVCAVILPARRMNCSNNSLIKEHCGSRGRKKKKRLQTTAPHTRRSPTTQNNRVRTQGTGRMRIGVAKLTNCCPILLSRWPLLYRPEYGEREASQCLPESTHRKIIDGKKAYHQPPSLKPTAFSIHRVDIEIQPTEVGD